MKKYYCVLFFIMLSFVSCNPISISDTEITVDKIIGTYDLKNGKMLTFNQDYTYEYSYPDSLGVFHYDTGIWKYQYFEATRRNQLKAFDERAALEIGVRRHFTEYQTFTFYFCKSWGKIVMTQGWDGDPDGSAIHWFYKID